MCVCMGMRDMCHRCVSVCFCLCAFMCVCVCVCVGQLGILVCRVCVCDLLCIHVCVLEKEKGDFISGRRQKAWSKADK